MTKDGLSSVAPKAGRGRWPRELHFCSKILHIIPWNLLTCSLWPVLCQCYCIYWKPPHNISLRENEQIRTPRRAFYCLGRSGSSWKHNSPAVRIREVKSPGKVDSHLSSKLVARHVSGASASLSAPAPGCSPPSLDLSVSRA